MLKIKRFLGYTDNIKEPRKTKVENSLRKLYRYKNSICSTVECFCDKLLEGCFLDKKENYQYYKRNGELTKPKTLYMFCDKDGKTFIEINKTEYDFIQYLINKGLNTEEAILNYDKADVEHIEALKQAEEEEKARQEEEKRRREEEKEQFKNWMHTESENIPQFQRDIIDAIFLAIYGTENSWNYSLAVCINNYDNPLCKEEVISRLHNDNKASIKIFECLTGLKLPKGYKERIEYLEGLTKADFKESIEYKPRKKAEHKEIQKDEFYIVIGNYTWQKVLAESVTKYGIDMFIFCDNGIWKLSHVETGMCITKGKNKTECMQKLKEIIDNKGIDGFNQLIEDIKQKIFERAGMNPLYEVA